MSTVGQESSSNSIDSDRGEEKEEKQSVDSSSDTFATVDARIAELESELAATSITFATSGTMSKSPWLGDIVPRSTKRDDDDIFGLGISVSKLEREKLKVNDKKTYYKVQESCTKGIESKFTQLKAIDENSPIDHFESVYSVVTRFDDLQESLRRNDMIDVFTIASEYELDGSGPTATATPVDLFHDIKSTDLGLVKLANQYFMEYGADYHGENVVWSGEKILNSCDDALRDKLIESTRGWSAAHKGGPTYLKLLMGLIVATSEKSLRSLLDKVGTLKLSDFNGEDVNKAVSFLRGAILILRDNDALPNDFGTLILKIFKQTSCDDFKSFVGLLEHNVELSMTKKTIEEILQLFETKYTEMLGRNEWTPKSITKGQESVYNMTVHQLKMMCFNCGGLGHGTRTCPQPLCQKSIAARKEIMANYSRRMSTNSNGGNNTSSQSDGGGNKNGNKSGRQQRGKGPSNPLKVPPQRDESHEKVFNGKTLYWCGKPKCCKWGDHKGENCPHMKKKNDDNANHVDDAASAVGDDSPSVTEETGGYAGMTLTATSLSGF